jgi:hypothetical protein
MSGDPQQWLRTELKGVRVRQGALTPATLLADVTQTGPTHPLYDRFLWSVDTPQDKAQLARMLIHEAHPEQACRQATLDEVQAGFARLGFSTGSLQTNYHREDHILFTVDDAQRLLAALGGQS